MNVLCNGDKCHTQAAEIAHLRQQLATARGELAQAQDATARLQDALGVAQEGYKVYYGMYRDLSAKEAKR